MFAPIPKKQPQKAAFLVKYPKLHHAEVALVNSADLADEIVGKVFPFNAGYGLVIDPTAEIADITHKLILL